MTALLSREKLEKWIAENMRLDNDADAGALEYSVDAGALSRAIQSGQLSPSSSCQEGWQPFETAPKDRKKFVALKVTIVDEYDDEFSRDVPIRTNVEMVEPVLMQWVQFASFMKGEFMEIPHKKYMNPVRYIGWAPLPAIPTNPRVPHE